MSRSDDERERLKRLRERQLRARNPNAKAEAQQRRISEHHGKTAKPINLRTTLDYVPLRWWTMVIGALLGLVIGVWLNVLVDASWTRTVLLIFILVGIVLGRLAGTLLEWRSDSWIDD
jgi:Flp pilus assembly protein TadB